MEHYNTIKMKNPQMRFKVLFSPVLLCLFAFFSSNLNANTNPDFCDFQCNYTVQNATCFGGSNGSATLNPFNGVGPYTFMWSTGATTATASGLSAGVYSFTITDQSGCSHTENLYVGQASAIQSNISRVNNVCRFDMNGSLTLAPSGGTPPYAYQWSNGATTASINNLISGPYSYTITDSQGCSKAGSYAVLSNNPVIGSLTTTDLQCYGDEDGSASIMPSGGNGGPYTINWSNGATGATVNGLSAGAHSYTITDGAGCTGSGAFAIMQPAPVWTTFDFKYACFGENNGTAEIHANGGTPPYSYQWSTGATTAAINNLAMGMYFYTVTDARGCNSAIGLVCIFESDYDLNATASAPNCLDGNDGSANLLVFSNFPPISIQWSNGATTANLTNLAPGTYSYTVTDGGNCPVVGSITIAQGAEVNATVSELGDGNLQAAGADGVAPYTYMWSNGETTAIATNYTSGDYSVTVTDANGCTDIVTGTLMTNDPCESNYTYPGTIASDQYLCAPGNTPATIIGIDAPTGGSGPSNFIWMQSSSAGAFDPSIFSPIENSNSANYSPGPLDVTTYFARCVRREGCVYLESNIVTITVGNEIEAVIDRPSVGCFGQTQTYTATNLPDGLSTISWAFSNEVTVNTTSGPTVEVTFVQGGYLDVVMTVTNGDCTGIFRDHVLISTCGELNEGNSQALHIPSNVYPNPVNDRVNVTLGTVNEQETTINILSITQQLLETYRVPAGQKHYDFSLEQLPSGMYWLQLHNTNGTVETLKVLKN